MGKAAMKAMKAMKKKVMKVSKIGKGRSATAKKAFATSALKRWCDAVKKARKELSVKGFCPVGGKTAQGRALYAKVKSILAGKWGAGLHLFRGSSHMLLVHDPSWSCSAIVTCRPVGL